MSDTIGNVGYNVLVIDDDPDDSFIVKELLSADDGNQFTTTLCVSISESQQLLNQNDYDVVLLDLNLGDAAGLTGLEELRNFNPEIPIVVLTGMKDKMLALSALQLGATDYLTKSQNRTDLLTRAIRLAVEKKRAEDISRRLLAMVESSGDAIITMDVSGVVKSWNGSAEKLTGYSREEAVGQAILYLLSGNSESELPAILQRPVLGQVVSPFEFIWKKKDRSEIPVLLTASPILENSEHIIGISLIARDMTEKKTIEKALAQAHDYTDQLLKSISSILIGVDYEGRIIQWNATAEKIFAMVASDVVGTQFRECGIGWDWEKVNGAISVCIQKNSPQRVDDLQYGIHSEHKQFVALTVNPLVRGTDHTGGFLILGAEVSEKKRLETQLSLAQKMESIGQMAAGIAHEMNTPIQYVNDNLQFLQDSFNTIIQFIHSLENLLLSRETGASFEQWGEVLRKEMEKAELEYFSEEVPRAIQQSLDGSDRVAKIVRAMKAFSHPGTETMQSVDLRENIINTLTVSRNEWKYVAEVETQFDDSLPLVLCLPGEFNQVILNLIVNAAHAVADSTACKEGRKGKITIITKTHHPWAIVQIRDSGTGIPERIRARIFDPFFTTKEVGKGTGQGLAIAHEVIVNKHKGEISVDSQMGIGTTFTIQLPLDPRSTSANSDVRKNDGEQLSESSNEKTHSFC